MNRLVARLFPPRIVAPALCPNCKCSHAITMAESRQHAGSARMPSGTVCECVKCGSRYTVTYSNEVVTYIGNRARQNVAPSGGREDGRPGWLDDDLPDLTLRP